MQQDSDSWVDFHDVYPGSGDNSLCVDPLRHYVGDSTWTVDEGVRPICCCS
jgi:hypothetical protein